MQKLLDLTNGGLARPDIRAGARLTEDLWNAAHGMHRGELRLHQSGVHGFGIAAGLQVTATEPDSYYVTIHPGLALDHHGRVLLVTEAKQDRDRLRLFNVQAGKEFKGWVFLLLEFRDDRREEAPDPTNNYVRVYEFAHCRVSTTPPGRHEIELARVLLNEDDRPVSNAADPNNPKIGEIDLRFRTVLASGQRGDVMIGQIAHSGKSEWSLHRTGLSLLKGYLQTAANIQASYQPLVRLNGDEQECDLLYLTGNAATALSGDQVQQLRQFLGGGGVLLAESCKTGFEKLAKELAKTLGIQLQPLPSGHPLLCSAHVFGTPPDGGPADTGNLSIGVSPEGGVMILSTRDYGCAWGGPDSLQRGRIRDALEFGANLANFAAERRRVAALERLAPPVTGSAV